MSLKVTGTDVLIRKLKKNATLTDVKKVVKLNTSELQRKTQRRAPVDTGNLKRSIAQTIQDEGLTGKVSTKAEYAPYVEWGTRFMYGRRFLGSSYVEQRKKFINDLKRLMG